MNFYRVFKGQSYKGHPRLVTALAELYTKLLNRPQDLDPLKEVLVTDGAYEALFTAILGHVNPGDEVIIIEPYFDCYEPMVRLAGGTPIFISLKPVSVNCIHLMFSNHLTRPKLTGLSAQQIGSLI